MTQTGLSKRVVEALGLCSKFSTAISSPAEASPLPKDVDGTPATENFNYTAIVGMMLYLSGHPGRILPLCSINVPITHFAPPALTRKHSFALGDT